MGINLGSLLERLNSKEEKGRLTFEAVWHRATDDPKHIQEAIKYAISKKHFCDAAELFHRTGNNEKTIEFYIKAGGPNIKTAAIVAGNMGDEKRRKEIYNILIDDYEDRGYFYQAAEYAVEIGFNERASQLYEKAGSYKEAIRQAEFAGNKERAQILCLLHM